MQQKFWMHVLCIKVSVLNRNWGANYSRASVSTDAVSEVSVIRGLPQPPKNVEN
jgi:hypothetical protein